MRRKVLKQLDGEFGLPRIVDATEEEMQQLRDVVLALSDNVSEWERRSAVL